MIRLLLLDVDGVLTDGGLYYGADGERMKRFNVRDGLGIKQLMAAGVTVAIVSGRDSPALRRRAVELGIAHVHAGVADKAGAAATIQNALGIAPAETAAMGDDLPDVPLYEAAMLRIAPADAEPEMLTFANFVTGRAGGHGAVRDAARHIIALNGSANADITPLHG